MSNRRDRCLEDIARCWCKPDTSNRTVDPELAQHFAGLLDEARRLAEDYREILRGERGHSGYYKLPWEEEK